jgi:hypothetical protein
VEVEEIEETTVEEAIEKWDSNLTNLTLNNKLRHPPKNYRSRGSEEIDLHKGSYATRLLGKNNSFSSCYIAINFIYTYALKDAIHILLRLLLLLRIF